MRLASEFLRGGYSLLFPASCAECGAAVENPEEAPVCARCLPRLPWNRAPLCLRCGVSLRNLGAGIDLCGGCRDSSPIFDQARSVFLYEKPLPDFIADLKYRGRHALIGFLAGHMAAQVRQCWNDFAFDRVIAIPMHETRRRERGYNQAERLADAVAQKLYGRPADALLVRNQPAAAQASLSRRDRLNNLVGTIELLGPSETAGKTVLLVDDVLTTGATADACAKALKQAGAKSVFVITAARVAGGTR